MRKPGEKITTSKLLTMIRGAETFEEATEYHARARDPVFSETLYETMTQRGLTPAEVIRMSGIERSYYYHILNGNRMPGRNVVLRLGFCLKLNLNEMNHMLTLAGLSALYPRIRRDAALIFAVQHKYTMQQANDLLIDAGEAPLYQGNDHA